MTGLAVAVLLLAGLLVFGTRGGRKPTEPQPASGGYRRTGSSKTRGRSDSPPGEQARRSGSPPRGQARRWGLLRSPLSGDGRRRVRSSPTGQGPDDSLPLLVHQLAGLLAAGRTPGALWADAAALCRAEAEAGSGLQRRAEVLEAASRAARLGLSVVPVLQEAAADTAGGRGRGSRGGAASDEARLWRDLAACVQVSEASGAPLSDLLHRYAGALESDLDAQEARAGVLAGPQATVRLLSWLPVGGLVLGYALGVDPLGTLLDSVFGVAILAAAAGLTIAGRVWSRRLVAAAAGAGEP